MAEAKPAPTVGQLLVNAKNRAMKGGLTGAAAQGVNVLALMWMRTTMNYQMAKGGTMVATIKMLYKEGGVPRFYRGLVPALIQSPISRFGDTFANAGALALCDSMDSTRNLPIALKTAAASISAGLMRILLMPIDAWKTNKQVHGAGGLGSVLAKIKTYPNRGPGNLWGWSTLWHGALAQASATAVGHWPWFVAYNYLDHYLPGSNGTVMVQVSRNAFIGLASAFISDCLSNWIRVLKTYRQTSKNPVGYWASLLEIKRSTGILGWNGLLFRGLQTRVVAHGINSMVFTVAWKFFQQMRYGEQAVSTKGGH